MNPLRKMTCMRRLASPTLAIAAILWTSTPAMARRDDGEGFPPGASSVPRLLTPKEEAAPEEVLPRSLSETPLVSPRVDVTPGSELFQIRGREWYAHMSGNLQSSGATLGTRLSFSSDLDLGGHVDVPEIQAYFNIPYLGRLYVDWWRYANTGDSTLTRTINFGDHSFTGGSTIHSRFDLDIVSLTYEYTLPTISLGGVSYLELGLQFGAKSLSAEASLDDSLIQGTTRGTTYAVVLGGRALVQILPWLRAEAELQGISVAISSEKVSYFETYVEAVAQPLPWLFAGVGYKYFQLTYRYEARLHFDLDFELSGAYLTVGVRF